LPRASDQGPPQSRVGLRRVGTRPRPLSGGSPPSKRRCASPRPARCCSFRSTRWCCATASGWTARTPRSRARHGRRSNAPRRSL
jgi:hypothetical protein